MDGGVMATGLLGGINWGESITADQLAALNAVREAENTPELELTRATQERFRERMFDLNPTPSGGGWLAQTPENTAYGNKVQDWQNQFEENFNNPFIQGENFVTEHYTSDRKLAEMLRDAQVGDKIPTVARAEFLTPLINKSGLTTVTPELQRLGEQFVFAGDAGYVKDAPAGNSGWLKQNAGPVLGAIGSMVPGLGTAVGAGLGSALGTGIQGGDFGDVLKAGALGYAGGAAGNYINGALANAPQGSFLGDIAGGVNTAGNFLDPIIPDFIKPPGANVIGNGGGSSAGSPSLGDFTAPDFNSLPTPDLSLSPSLSDALANVSPTFNIPSVPVLPNIAGGTVGASPTPTAPSLDLSFEGLANQLDLSPTGTSGNFVSDTLETIKDNSLAENLNLAGTAIKLGSLGAGLVGATADGGTSPTEQKAIFPKNTFSETPPNAEYRNATGSSGSVTLPKLVYDQASPFRKSLMQSAIDSGKLVISGGDAGFAAQPAGGNIQRTVGEGFSAPQAIPAAGNIQRVVGSGLGAAQDASLRPIAYGDDNIAKGVSGLGYIPMRQGNFTIPAGITKKI